MELVLAILLTALAYLIFPIIYRSKNGKVCERKAKKIALWNSIICEAIFTIGEMLIGADPTTMGSLFAQGFLFYFISHSILVDYNLKDSSSNAKKKNSINDNQSTIRIKALQKTTLVIVIISVLFAIIYPVSIGSAKNNKIPSTEEYKTVQITKLDATQTVFCSSDGVHNFVYIKEGKKINVYRFANYSMYNSSNNVKNGYATTFDIKNYFEGVKAGQPDVNFVFPSAMTIGLIIGGILIIALVIICCNIHKLAHVDIFNRVKTDKYLEEIKKQFKNDELLDSEYKRKQKEYYSQSILENKGLFKLFKFLY